jgi:hypothetical protein
MIRQGHEAERRRRPGGFEPGSRICHMSKLVVVRAIVGNGTFQGIAVIGMGQTKDLLGSDRRLGGTLSGTV